MKKIVVLLFLYVSSLTAVENLVFDSQTVVGNYIRNGCCRAAVDSRDYLNGGITITYDTDWFHNPPIVFVSIELRNLVYSSTDTITALVTSNSASSTTIRVNIDDGTTTTEAATNDVIVSVLAICKPNMPG